MHFALKPIILITLLSAFLISCNSADNTKSNEVADSITAINEIQENEDSLILNEHVDTVVDTVTSKAEVTTDKETVVNKNNEKKASDTKKPQSNTKTNTSKSESDDCPPDIMCTAIFVTLKLTILDQQGEPVALDMYNVYYGGSILGINKVSDTHTGQYTIADDGLIKYIPKKGAELTIKGFIKNKQVVSHTVVIGHDCCHVKWIRGSKKITIFL